MLGMKFLNGFEFFNTPYAFNLRENGFSIIDHLSGETHPSLGCITVQMSVLTW